MRTGFIRIAGSATALSLLAAGAVAAQGATEAAAQSVVTTQKYTIGNGSVTDATAVAQPDTAGTAANYTLGFTTPTALARGSDTITLSDPNASTTFPGGQTDYFLIDNTNSSGDQPVSGANLASGGHSVTLGLSEWVSARDSLSLYVIGVTNPARVPTVLTFQHPKTPRHRVLRRTTSSLRPRRRPSTRPLLRLSWVPPPPMRSVRSRPCLR